MEFMSPNNALARGFSWATLLSAANFLVLGLSGTPAAGLSPKDQSSQPCGNRRCSKADSIPTQATHKHSPETNATVCKDLIARKVDFFDFSLMHVLPLELTYSFKSLSPGNWLAKIDIDNDGTPDNVVELRNNFCRSDSGPLLAVTNLARTEVNASPLNDLLIEELRQPRPCDLAVTAFRRSGTTYVDTVRSGIHVVYLIHNAHAERICRTRRVEDDIAVNQRPLSP